MIFLRVLHSEKKSILTVGPPGSGGATGKTLITLSGLWTMRLQLPDDLLVIIYSNYGSSAIFNEYLGISPSEYDIFTIVDTLMPDAG